MPLPVPAPPAPPSPFAWPVLLGASATLFPVAAALATRRPLRGDPGGRLALAWGVIGALNLLPLGQLLGAVPRGWPVLSATVVVVPFLLVPPLLAWLGGAAGRPRLLVLAAIAAAFALTAAAVGTGREFRLVAHPLMSLAVAAVAAVVLCDAVRRGGGAADDGRGWMAGGVASYFLLGAAWRPLAETLLRSRPAAMVDVHMGIQLAFAGCLTAIAWGVAHPRPARAATPPVPHAAAR